MNYNNEIKSKNQNKPWKISSATAGVDERGRAETVRDEDQPIKRGI